MKGCNLEGSAKDDEQGAHNQDKDDLSPSYDTSAGVCHRDSRTLRGLAAPEQGPTGYRFTQGSHCSTVVTVLCRPLTSDSVIGWLFPIQDDKRGASFHGEHGEVGGWVLRRAGGIPLWGLLFGEPFDGVGDGAGPAVRLLNVSHMRP